MTKSTLGFLYIIIGLVIVLLAIGTLLLKICVAIFGLALINKGIQLRNMPSVQSMMYGLFLKQRRWF